ncbi:hypothetical protein SBRY_100054 [Actinacidiphila bryophytorum]|uniref:Uncharacterized protein n=1 Tax=Actinacidiphila bryophytorum TaxID=1436133 RepID=A0A9W4E0X8_9ACTN|nr:hypothetical protein SBRY_100054 [Actinacidiphila bryophytorum]
MPLKWFISVVMWLSIADCRSDADRLETQEGSWLCQTRVWPRIRCPCDWAWETIWSPGPKLKFPRDGSVVSHFISFSGVIMLNSRSRIAVYAEVPSFPAGTAVPKYRPDCAAAAPSELAAAAWGADVARATTASEALTATPVAAATAFLWMLRCLVSQDMSVGAPHGGGTGHRPEAGARLLSPRCLPWRRVSANITLTQAGRGSGEIFEIPTIVSRHSRTPAGTRQYISQQGAPV